MRDTVRFILGGEIRELSAVDPAMTVLQYLRGEPARCGTKEGCAEGDCGACSVVLAEPANGALRYSVVNACIQLVGVLDGKQLITVEDLSGADGALHPVQRAMVEKHGSQCGFCTPGIVMSLFGLYHADPSGDQTGIADALAGNLCRCTGYGPIIECAREADAARPADQFSRGEAAMRKMLERIRPAGGLSFEGASTRCFAPAGLDELCALASAHPDAWLVAGSSDVGLWITKQHRRPETLIHLGNVAELKTLEADAEGVEIGAGVTLTRAHEMLARHFPGMDQLIRRFASRQIRNVATLGGNIANGSPIGDMPPALIALDASVTLRRGGNSRTISLQDFFIGYGRQDRKPGEIITSIRVPALKKSDRYRCYKLSKRFDQDISSVCGAFWLRLEGGTVGDARFAFGGMAAVPKRASAAEEAVIGAKLDGGVIERAGGALGADFSPLSDLRGTDRYRLRAAGNILRKFLLQATGAKVADIYAERGAAHV